MFRSTLFCHPQVELRTQTDDCIIWPQLNNSVGQIPSPVANIFPASHEFLSKSWNRMVHFLHNSQLATFLHPVPDKSNPCTSFHSLNIRFNITLQSSPRASGWSLPIRFPHQIFVCISPCLHACHMPLPPYSSWFVHPLIQLSAVVFRYFAYRQFDPNMAWCSRSKM